MFSPDFYPTPTHLATRMASMIDKDFSSRILEPSAGKGDLVQAVKARFERSYQPKLNVDCIEKEPELRALLTGSGYRVIDTDFLAYTSTKQYDTIIMNPPFSNGDDHVLKAWDLIYNGDVIALLNAETIRNPFSKSRKLLVSIIEQHGTIEFIEGAFNDAERKTDIDVALIHLKKRNSINADYFGGMKAAGTEYEPAINGNQLAIPESRIENMVLAYDNAVMSKRKAVIAEAEASYYANLIEGNGTDKTEMVKQSLNEFVEGLRKSAWRTVINLADFHKYMTEKVRREFESQLEIVSQMEFTAANIKTFLKNLMADYDTIIEDCIEEAFDLMTRYHTENRVHIEGWKSNDYFFVKRVVLPNMVCQYGLGKNVRWEKVRELDDIDKALAHISGLPELINQDGKSVRGYQRVSDALNADGVDFGQAVESEFFKARIFKKGTVHLYFKDLMLLQQFNLIIGRKRAWLPKEDKKVPEAFWLMNKEAA
jgi:hypothetical protein